MLGDYDRLSSLEVPGAADQEWPERFQRRPDESLSTWRDRVYQMYRIPYILSALSALKEPYVELVNPLLTRRSVETIRSMPDEVRTNKELFRDHVDASGPDVRIARTGATPEYNEIFGAPATVQYLRSELDTPEARDLFGAELVEWTLDEMGERTEAGSGSAPSAAQWSSLADALKYSAANALPTRLTSFVARHAPVDPPAITIDPNHLAFRLYLVRSMVDRLERDVGALDTRTACAIER